MAEVGVWRILALGASKDELLNQERWGMVRDEFASWVVLVHGKAVNR